MTFTGLNEMGVWSILLVSSRDRLVVRTLRCGRSNPGSNPGHGSDIFEQTPLSTVHQNLLQFHSKYQ